VTIIIACLYYNLRLHAKHHKIREKKRERERSKKRLGIIAVKERLNSRIRRKKKRLSKEV
jgi:hypothetical protein